MTKFEVQAVTLLTSIDTSLRTLVSGSQRRAEVRSGDTGRASTHATTDAGAQAQTPAPEIASDRDLDGSYGDPMVRMTPRDWSGPSYKTRPMSECPPEFLDQLADLLDWTAEQAESKNEMTDAGKPIGAYRRRDAGRARGWAARKRRAPIQEPGKASETEPAKSTTFSADDWDKNMEDDIPF